MRLFVLAEVPGLSEGAATEVADVRSLVSVDQQVLRKVRGGVEALPTPALVIEYSEEENRSPWMAALVGLLPSRGR